MLVEYSFKRSVSSWKALDIRKTLLMESCGRVIIFFFSSRRRHTRWNCDWSRRVLFRSHRLLSAHEHVRVLDDLSRRGSERNVDWLSELHGDRFELVIGDVRDARTVDHAVQGVDHRSEERRVGKECRSRWWANQ